MNATPSKDDYLRVSLTTSLVERNRMETDYVEYMRAQLERNPELTPELRANLRHTTDFSILPGDDR
jgi:hypothetical protein